MVVCQDVGESPPAVEGGMVTLKVMVRAEKKTEIRRLPWKEEKKRS